MQSAFAKAGFSKAQMALYGPLATYRNNGGTLEGLVAVWKSVERMSGKGHAKFAASHEGNALPRQPQASGAGRVSDAARPVTPCPPAREPSQAQRNAARRVAQTMAVTVLDTHRIRDGRAIGDVRFGELDRIRSSNTREAALLRLIQRHAQADDNMRVRDVVKAKDMQIMIQKAAEIADAS